MTAPPDDPAREFHLKEYDALRQEILAHSAAVMTMAQYAVAASGAVYFFLLVSKPEGPLRLANLPLALAGVLPVLFAATGSLLSNQQHRRMQQIGAYLREIERGFGRPGLGWEGRVPALENRPASTARLALRGAWFWFWLLLALGTVAIFAAIVVYTIVRNPPAAAAPDPLLAQITPLLTQVRDELQAAGADRATARAQLGQAAETLKRLDERIAGLAILRAAAPAPELPVPEPPVPEPPVPEPHPRARPRPR